MHTMNGSLSHMICMLFAVLVTCCLNASQALGKPPLHNTQTLRSEQVAQAHRPAKNDALSSAHSQDNPAKYSGSNGRIEFYSEAPLELIKAWSDEMRGIMLEDGQFAFSVNMSSFDGFNSGLQREHFRENYLEIERFPKASFEGELIEQPDWSQPGVYPVRVRGLLSIHGQSRERILPATIEVHPDGTMFIDAEFAVPLQEHQILIPRIMHQKIAESIRVVVHMSMLRQ